MGLYRYIGEPPDDAPDGWTPPADFESKWEISRYRSRPDEWEWLPDGREPIDADPFPGATIADLDAAAAVLDIGWDAKATRGDKAATLAAAVVGLAERLGGD